MEYVPPALASLLNMSTMMTPPSQMAGLSQGESPMPSYEMGGMVGPNGAPVRPNVPGMPGVTPQGTAGGIGPQQMELEARRFVQQHPQQVAQIREAIEEALSEGDITLDQVQILSQMAKVALQNPEMYPQLRQTIIAQGIVEDSDMPPEPDQGVLFVLLLIGQIMGSPAQGAGAATGGPPAAMPSGGGAPSSMPSMKAGGPLPEKSKRADGSIPINAHEGEYVIPAAVVRAKGTDFFDKMVESYTQPKS